MRYAVYSNVSTRVRVSANAFIFTAKLYRVLVATGDIKEHRILKLIMYVNWQSALNCTFLITHVKK